MASETGSFLTEIFEQLEAQIVQSVSRLQKQQDEMTEQVSVRVLQQRIGNLKVKVRDQEQVIENLKTNGNQTMIAENKALWDEIERFKYELQFHTREHELKLREHELDKKATNSRIEELKQNKNL